MRAAELEALAGRVVLAGFPGTSPPVELAEALRGDALAGVVLFARNARTPAEARALVAGLQAAPRGLIVALDQEGGRVARLGPPMPTVPPAATRGRGESAETRRVAERQGKALRAAGVSMNLAPVFDVHTNDANPVIGDRAFAATAEAVRRHAGAFASGLEAAGLDVLPAPMAAASPPASTWDALRPRMKAFRDSGWAIHEWIGRLWYAVR